MGSKSDLKSLAKKKRDVKEKNVISSNWPVTMCLLTMSQDII